MSINHIDLDTYCTRIGYTGVREPTFATLAALNELHTRTIAFEDLSSLLGEQVSIDLHAIQDKLLQQGRGGYCFEHNTLLWNVLEQLGFKVSGLAARVRWNIPEQVVTPIGHMVLKVNVGDDAYLVDAGFGGLTLTTPLRLDTEAAQPTTHEPFRITRDNGGRTLSAKLGDEWKSLYTFDLHDYLPADYAVWNWFTCTAPQSPFVDNLMAARPVAGGRHALLNNRHTYRSLTGEVTTRMLTTAHELRGVLEQAFDIRVPNSESMHGRLAEIAIRSA